MKFLRINKKSLLYNSFIEGKLMRNNYEKEIKKLGKNVKILREKRNWTINDLSEKSKISAAYLLKIENGETKKLNTHHLVKLFNAFNLSALKELF